MSQGQQVDHGLGSGSKVSFKFTKKYFFQIWELCVYFLFFPRVPFLDQQFLEYAMEIDPSEKMCGKGTIEKKV